MMESWAKERYYQHLDALCGVNFINRVKTPAYVARHAWCPLIHFERITKRYKKKTNRTILKVRPIMYASHRDAMVFSKYAFDLSNSLEKYYAAAGIGENIIAYRKLGMANYDFASDVEQFVQANAPCCVMCFDFSKFFDTLDHAYLKARLKQILDQRKLSDDWYSVFKALTQFRYVKLLDLWSNPVFAKVLEAGRPKQIATVEQVRLAGINFTKNCEEFGIPQGTPMSAVASNVYMVEFDVALATLVKEIGGLYRRYSDDMLVVVPIELQDFVVDAIYVLVADAKLRLNNDKTEINVVNATADIDFQYLGFEMKAGDAAIRGQSLARQHRKLKYGVSKIARSGHDAIACGRATKVFTKRLRKRFVQTKARNFPAYTRRAAAVFGSKRMLRQALRMERRADSMIREL